MATSGNPPAYGVTPGTDGSALYTQYHGKFYTANYRSKVFLGGALVAGVTLPVVASTSPTFTLYNPVGSGVNLELIRFQLGALATTTVIGTIFAGFSTQTPTVTTAGGFTIAANGGSATALGLIYTVATVTAATNIMALGTVQAVTDSFNLIRYDFDGTVIIPPGGCMVIGSNPTQTGVTVPSLLWAEHAI